MTGRACTGLTASWCPVHGDCTCPRDKHHGDFTEGVDAGDCPLHNLNSGHPRPMPRRATNWPAVVADAALAMNKATGRTLIECLTVLDGLAYNAEPSDERDQRRAAIAYLLRTQGAGR